MRYRPEIDPAPEDLFNVTVSFNDGASAISVKAVPESDLVSMYRCLGESEGRLRLQPEPGYHYMTAIRRVKDIKAFLTTKESD